jgi:surface antigen
MAGPVARRISFLPPYSGTVVASLRLGAALLIASAGGGCAVSGHFGSLFGKSAKEEARAEASDDISGSIGARAGQANAAALPAEADLAYARIAVVDVLKRGSKEISAPWENPATGARGTVTPIASNYTKDGATCREFLASYVRLKGSESWLQGEACRARQGGWEVKSLRPWTRS